MSWCGRKNLTCVTDHHLCDRVKLLQMFCWGHHYTCFRAIVPTLPSTSVHQREFGYLPKPRHPTKLMSTLTIYVNINWRFCFLVYRDACNHRKNWTWAQLLWRPFTRFGERCLPHPRIVNSEFEHFTLNNVHVCYGLILICRCSLKLGVLHEYSTKSGLFPKTSILKTLWCIQNVCVFTALL